SLGGNLGCDPAGFPAFFDDGVFDVLDGDRRFDHSEHTGTLTRSGADPSGEFRKIVGLVQASQRFLPAIAINQVIPFRNEIVDRATAGHAADQLSGVAEGSAAIHAAGPLFLKVLVFRMNVEFLPVLDPLV